MIIRVDNDNYYHLISKLKQWSGGMQMALPRASLHYLDAQELKIETGDSLTWLLMKSNIGLATSIRGV